MTAATYNSSWNQRSREIFMGENGNQNNCTYYTRRYLNSLESDTFRWYLMIGAVSVGKDEIIVGSLYKLFPGNESDLVFERRIKEYTQKSEFESGKYLGLTYYIENDTTMIVKLGTGKY